MPQAKKRWEWNTFDPKVTFSGVAFVKNISAGFMALRGPGRSRGRPGWGGVTCFLSRLGWRQVGCWAGYEGGSCRESLHFMSLRRSRRKIRWKTGEVKMEGMVWRHALKASVKPKVADKSGNVSATLNILLFAFRGAVVQLKSLCRLNRPIWYHWAAFEICSAQIISIMTCKL